MPTQSNTDIDAPSRALLSALGASFNVASLPALAVAEYCLDKAYAHTHAQHFAEWGNVTRELQRLIRRDGDRLSPPGNDSHNSPARNVWELLRCPQSPNSQELQLSELLARAVVVGCVTQRAVSTPLVSGARKLQGAISGKGQRSAAWNALANRDLLSTDDLGSFFQVLPPTDPAHGFVRAGIAALSHALGGPTLLAEQPAVNSSGATEAPESLDPDSVSEQQKQGDSEDGERTPMDPTPRIEARLKAAEASSVAEKFGIHDRDYLLPADFAPITKRTQALLTSSQDREIMTFAALAQVSVVTGCTDYVAVNLRFEPTDSIWLALEDGAWCWDFEGYRRHVTQESTARARTPVPTPLPAELVRFLREARAHCLSAQTLAEVLSAYSGTPLELQRFRVFLRALGATAQPVYRGRLSRSLVHVYLAETGSDMTASQATGQFAVCAPAALFYFGPSEQTRFQRTAKVYQFLGMGAPFGPGATDHRMPCRKVLEAAELRVGWASLTVEINDCMVSLRQADQSSRLAIANRAMALLCTAFVIQTAHRSTRLDLLTFGALYAHPDCLVIIDKQEGDRHPGRLLPKTEQVLQILGAAYECHQLSGGPTINRYDADLPVFIRWSPARVAECLSTADIVRVVQLHFQASDGNFARSAWVTHLDEGGCDRWLIRSLTGHTRDVTRTTEPYFNTSPVEFASRLKAEMERVGAFLFGRAQVGGERQCRVNLHCSKLASRAPKAPRASPNGPVPDPRSILEGITPQTLVEWRAVIHIREQIAGGVEAPLAQLALLSLIFMDLVPDQDLCIRVIEDPGKHVRRYGRQAGILWQRTHFLHPTWIPIDSLTERLIDLAANHGNHANLDAFPYAQLFAGDSSPVTGDGLWDNMEALRRSFVRIELPPSLQAAADPFTPAPTLSDLSLLRLAATEKSAPTTSPVPAEIAKRSSRQEQPLSAELKTVRQQVHRWTANTEKLGELRKRAIGLRAEIRSSYSASSLHSLWIYDWLMDELELTAASTHGRLDISSIYTYLCVLITRTPSTLEGSDPYEWQEEEWVQWLAAIEQTPATDAHAERELAALSEPVKHAVARLIRNLQRKGFSIPSSIRSRVLEASESQAHGSASSTLILGSDLSAARELCDAWFAERPLEQLLVRTRFVAHAIPSRTSEISSLKLDCITDGGALLLDREGYKVHKTDNAVRLVLLTPEHHAELSILRDQLVEHHPEGSHFLLRGDGSLQAGIRDVALARACAAALKITTGDSSARIHCLRAASLQQVAWPNWTSITRQLLQTGLSVQSAKAWTHEVSSLPTRLTFACVQAGHGDLRPALGNYLAAWPLILHVHAKALQSSLPLQRKLIRLVHLNPNNYAQALRRSGRTLTVSDWVHAQGPFLQLCEHTGMPTGAAPVAAQPLNETVITDADESGAMSAVKSCPATATLGVVTTLTHNAGGNGPRAQFADVAYVTARVLGLSKARAIEYADVPLSTASELDAISPSLLWGAWVAKRARAQPGRRGEAANLQMLTGNGRGEQPMGARIAAWAYSISHRTSLCNVVLRQPGKMPPLADLISLWHELAGSMPSGISLVIHRRNLIAAESQALAHLTEEVRIHLDINIGPAPLVKLYPRGSDNRVLSSRYTANLRAVVCALAAVEGVLPEFP